jgi:hypothetical protein
MSQGSNTTQMSYECSRQSSSVKSETDFSEWTNEFTEGIELKKGDTVRLLGSFVHQGSTAEEIEVENDMELNIAYSPFILADTIDTLDSTTDGSLQNIADICDLAYGTDSFGIEPPVRNTTQSQTTDGEGGFAIANINEAGELPFPNQDRTLTPAEAGGYQQYTESAYSDPSITGIRGGDMYGLTFNFWSINNNNAIDTDGSDYTRSQFKGDSSSVFGTNIKTDILYTDQNKVKLDYSNFAKSTANCEMYVGNQVKKLILPVFDKFHNFNANGNANGSPDGVRGIRTLDPLVLDPPVEGVGMLNGCPKVGMCIATANIAQGAGWFDSEGNGYFENTWDDPAGPLDQAPNYVAGSAYAGGGNFRYAGQSGYTGVPNLAGGVESVIGTIIATRPILHNINGKSTPCWELMVSQFINPASLSTKPIIKNFNKVRLTNASNFFVGDATETVTCFKPLHGSGTSELNSNFNPSINNINGAFNHMDLGTIRDRTKPGGYKAGMGSNTPTRNNYLLNSPVNGPNYRTQFEQGGTEPNASYFEMGIGQSQGLSYLWNGSHTGYMRYDNTVSNVDRYRANHLLYWDRFPVNNNELCAVSKINDIRLEVRSGVPVDQQESYGRTALLMEMGSVPVAYGAYIICKEETMLDIVKGEYTNLADYWVANDTNQPRIWFDYAYQQTDSNYKVRHYKGNSYDCSKITLDQEDASVNNTIFPRGSDAVAGSVGEYKFPPPFVEDVRYNWNMCGRPPCLNFRNSSGQNGADDIVSGITIDDLSRVAGNSGTDQFHNLAVGDFMPRYFNTPTGLNPLTETSSNHEVSSRGLPSVWGGYNTCINSIYFQQKETGDTTLGATSLRSIGVCHQDTDIGGGFPKVIQITKATLFKEFTAETYTPIQGNFLRIVGINDCQFHPTSEIDGVVDGGLMWIITLYHRIYADVPINTQIIVSSGPSFMPKASGINGNAWSSDHIMVKEQLIKLKVEAGFYTEEQLGERINDQLHYDINEYTKRFGTKNVDGSYSIPTTNGILQRALQSQPSIVNGNFVGTYLPDVNYAFSPVTVDNASDLDLTASTKDITNELLTYEPVLDGGGNIIYYHPELISTTPNGTTIRRLYDHSTAYPTQLGKHFKIYTVPSYDVETPTPFKELTLARLRGGSLNTQLDFTQDGSPPSGPTYWHNDHVRFAGSYEMLRAYEFDMSLNRQGDTFPQNYLWTSNAIYAYRTRLTRNIFSSGGSARIFIGANNFTFSWEEGANRYSFNNLYTPLRPHKPETNGTDTKEDFGIGDAIPSAVINSRPNGTIISQLCGIYINNLNGDLFTQENWGAPIIGDNYQYDLITTQERLLKNTTFLNILGFTLEQLNDLSNTFDSSNPNDTIFLYRDELTQSGTAIRVGAKLTTAVNGSNPLASKCLAIAPVTQFMVQISTDDFFAQNSPLKGNDPYFFIGSTFPFKQFHGNLNGAKLPIMGICARNFQAFGFSFDLGGSAVSYLIEEDTTITSITTKIYTSQLQTPSNLSPYSSIIYLITRYDYLKNLTPQQGEMQLQQTITNMNRPMVPFYSPPLALARTAPPVYPNRYYYTGYPATIQEVEEEEEEE